MSIQLTTGILQQIKNRGLSTSLSSEMQDALALATAQTWTPHTEPIILAIDAWIKREKDAGRWAKYDEAIVGMGDGGKPFKRINLVDPILASWFAEDGTLVNNDLYIAGNGSDGCLVGVLLKDGTAGGNWAVNNGHVAGLFSSFTGTYVIHNNLNSARLKIGVQSTNNRIQNGAALSPELDLTSPTVETIIACAKASNTQDVYVNGTKTSHTSTNNLTGLGAIYLFGRGLNTTFNTSQLQILTTGAALDDTEAAGWRTSALQLRTDITALI